MRGMRLGRSSVGSSRSVLLVDGEVRTYRAVVGVGDDRRGARQPRGEVGLLVPRDNPGRRSVEGREPNASARGCLGPAAFRWDDARHQHTNQASGRRQVAPPPARTRLMGACSADCGRIPGVPKLRHTPDSRPLALPASALSCTIPLILHESSTARAGRPVLQLGSRINEVRRCRGVVLVGSRSTERIVGPGGLSGSNRDLSRPSSRDDAGRKGPIEQALLPSRTCYRASCYRGSRERPMKMKAVRRVGEGIRSRPILSSGVIVPDPSASYCEGVGRTRP